MNGMKVLSWGVGVLGAFLFVFTGYFSQYDRFPPGLEQPQTFLSGTVAGFFLLVSLLVAHSTMGVMRAASPAIIAQNQKIHVNPHDGIYPAGEWLCKRVGGVLAMMVSLPGMGGTWIIPNVAIETYGESLIVKANVHRVPYSDLPPEVRKVVDNEGLPPPYKIGYSARFIETFGTDWAHKTREFSIKNASANAIDAAQSRTVSALESRNRTLYRQMTRTKGPEGFLKQMFATKREDDGIGDPERRE